jgi:DNA-binding NtrC family response regulator
MASPIILIVDDDRAIANMFTEVLRAEGYEVVNAQTGEEAVRLASLYRSGIGLLLCDVLLKDRSGPDIALRLGEFCPRMKIVFTSGYPVDILAERGLLTPELLRNENALFMQKPLRLRELLDLADRILETHAHAVAAAVDPVGGARVSAAH